MINKKKSLESANLLKAILICLSLILLPMKANSAEILQINDPKTILVGDQNRNLSLRLHCIDINKNDEEQAINILEKNFPRGTKVKIKPYGSSDNRLIAKVYKINSQIEMTNLLNDLNASHTDCID